MGYRCTDEKRGTVPRVTMAVDSGGVEALISTKEGVGRQEVWKPW